MKTVTKYVCELTGKDFLTEQEARTNEEIEKRVAERLKPKAMTVGEVVAALERIAQTLPTCAVYFEFAYTKPLTAEATDGFVYLRCPIELANGAASRSTRDWITTLKKFNQSSLVRVDCGEGKRGTPIAVCGVSYRGWLTLLQTFWDAD